MKGTIWYVGDEVNDVVSAKAAKVKVAAVSWGFANRNSLVERQPDFIADKPKDLLNIPERVDNK